MLFLSVYEVKKNTYLQEQLQVHGLRSRFRSSAGRSALNTKTSQQKYSKVVVAVVVTATDHYHCAPIQIGLVD